jgi:hypothetical protein
MKPPPGKKQDKFIILAIPTFFLLLILLALINAMRIRRYQPFLDAYIQQYSNVGEESVPSNGLPQPIKAIAITPNVSEDGQTQAGKYLFSSMTDRLPAKVRAKNPQEINVLVLVVESDVTVGTYDDGAPAYRKQLEVFIIDARSNAIVTRGVFQGGPPPLSKSHSQPGYGSMPTGKAVRWIRDMLGGI